MPHIQTGDPNTRLAQKNGSLYLAKSCTSGFPGQGTTNQWQERLVWFTDYVSRMYSIFFFIIVLRVVLSGNKI